jgi:hypothetical protein
MNNSERYGSRVLIFGGILLLILSFLLLPNNPAYAATTFAGCSTTDCTSNDCVDLSDCGTGGTGTCPTGKSGCEDCACKLSGGMCQCTI